MFAHISWYLSVDVHRCTRVLCLGMDHPVHRGDAMSNGLHDRYCAMYVIFYFYTCFTLYILYTFFLVLRPMGFYLPPHLSGVLILRLYLSSWTHYTYMLWRVSQFLGSEMWRKLLQLCFCRMHNVHGLVWFCISVASAVHRAFFKCYNLYFNG